jgi:hypothetical protein
MKRNSSSLLITVCGAVAVIWVLDLFMSNPVVPRKPMPRASAAPAQTPLTGMPEYSARAVVSRDDCSIPNSKKGLAVLKTPGIATENEMVAKYRLFRVNDLEDLRFFIGHGALVPFEPTVAYDFDQTFAEHDPDNAALYKHGREHVKLFLDDVLGEGYRCFGSRFLITSLTRTDDYQRDLKRRNKNAARGTKPSNITTHTTGSTVDIGAALMPLNVRKWLRHKLARLEMDGRIQATEETRRWSTCFHVMVYPDRWP